MTGQMIQMPVAKRPALMPHQVLHRKPKAIRLAPTKNLSRADWLEVRKKGIGSSDAAAACGLNPYMSMLELWMIKTGRQQSNINEDIKGYAPLFWGNQLEPIIANWYSQVTENKVRRTNAVLQHPDPHYHFMLANLDYSVSNSSEVQILECKSAGEYGSKLWKDGVPVYVLMQVQHQLAVTGHQAAHIAVLLHGHEAKIFKVERNETVIRCLLNAEKQFWHYVETDTPPPADASESAAKALQQLYPQHVPDKLLDLSHDHDMNKLFKELLSLQRNIEQMQLNYDQLRNRLTQHMQDAERAKFSAGTATWKKSKDAKVLDSKNLLLDQPELLDKYPQIRQGSRRFSIKANPSTPTQPIKPMAAMLPAPVPSNTL